MRVVIIDYSVTAEDAFTGLAVRAVTEYGITTMHYD